MCRLLKNANPDSTLAGNAEYGGQLNAIFILSRYAKSSSSSSHPETIQNTAIIDW